MRRIAVVLILFATPWVGCSKEAKVGRGLEESSGSAVSPQAKDATMTQASGDCVTTLAALTAGRLGEFGGLEGCTRADADTAFAAAGQARAAGTDAASVRYPAQGIATDGVAATFQGDTLMLVDIRRPEGAMTAPEELLGAPEATMGSKLAGATKQWIYASRGLVVHYRNAEQRYMAILAFPPMSKDEFLASPLATIQGPIRDPIR